ncbi:MAG: ArsR family transcriptional regulator [Lapillicoccus sp.]
MSPRPVSPSAGVHAALASPTRRQLLTLLQAADDPRDVHDLGQAVGLHPSTVRFHLETLRHAGLVSRQRHPHSGIGRPRTAYAAAARAREGEGYEVLAQLFAANLSETSKHGAARAESIGARWAEQLIPARVEAGAGATMDEAAEQVSGLLGQLGFAPKMRAVGQIRQMALHACPFRAVAREHPEVVCAVHLGLLRGSLERLGASATTRLLPFVEPELCMVEVTSTV